MTAGIDLALAMVEEDLGADVETHGRRQWPELQAIALCTKSPAIRRNRGDECQFEQNHVMRRVRLVGALNELVTFGASDREIWTKPA
jgi:hypothetical protein